jgi:hypothetical protein
MLLTTSHLQNLNVYSFEMAEILEFRIIMVRKNYVFGNGGKLSSDKILCRHQKIPHRDP